MHEPSTTSASESPSPRGTAPALLSLLALVLAPFSWLWTIDRPFLRASGLTAWILLAGALALALSAARRDRRLWVRAVAGVQVVALALALWAFFGLSRLPETGVAALERAPDFTLPDQDGRPVTLSAELAKGPVLLVFFRGHW